MSRSTDYDNILVWIVGFLIASALTARKVVSMLDVKTKAQYKAAVTPYAVNIARQTGINPSLAIIQAAHESNWGQSELTRTAHNHFGMTPGDAWLSFMRKEIGIDKVPAWSGTAHPVIYRQTTEYSHLPPNKIRYWEFPGDVVSKTDDGNGGSKLTINRAFRAYASDQESFDDWARLISGSPRFAQAYAGAKGGDLTAFANGLVMAKYATDVNYSAELQKVADVVSALA